MSSPFFNELDLLKKHKRNLPHWQQGEVWQFVTWRLADSLPLEKLNQLRLEKQLWLRQHPEPWEPDTEIEYHRLFSQRVEKWLDAGYGSCVLGEPASSLVVEGSLHFFDGIRYSLGPYVIMPNHVHVLIQQKEGWRIEDILQSWKSYTAKQINKMRGTSGPFWQLEYWDRIVRSEEQWHAYRLYIERNPRGLQMGTFILGVGSKSNPL
ncbi:MAG: transposase [Candidatus Sumerlaeia bacterium]|nr:transposase [Candidatus Sumerlaeia bacterium]